ADRLGAVVAQAQLPVELDPLLLREGPLLFLELIGDVEETFLDPLRRHRLTQEGEVVAEQEDRAGIEHPFVLADQLFEEDRRHRRDVLVAEPDVGHHEAFVPRLHRRNADLALRRIHDPVTGQHLFAERHRTAWRGRRAQDDFALKARHVVVEEAVVLDDARGDLAFALGESGERDLLTTPYALDDREIGRGQDTEVLAMLAGRPLPAALPGTEATKPPCLTDPRVIGNWSPHLRPR